MFLAIGGWIRVSVLAGGSNLIAGVTNGLNKLADLRLSMASAKPYFETTTQFFEKSKAQAQGAQLPEMRQEITVENLSFSYDGEKQVLANCSLRFAKGGKYALTGPSGCGKSTVLKLILGWLTDYQGTIRIDGTDIREYSPEQLQSRIGYVDQNVFLFNATIRENITLGGEFSEEELASAVHRSALKRDLAAMPLGLDTPAGEGGANLSGGQRQRIAIARALIHNRSILLVDEGTSALDQKNADVIEQSLLNIADLTLILVSHHLSAERKAQFTQVYAMAPGEGGGDAQAVRKDTR